MNTLTRTLALTTLLLTSAALVAGCNSGSRDSAASTTSPITSQIPGSGSYALALSVAGTGSGTVTVDPPSATNTWPAGTNLTLTASPDPGSTFMEWGGDLAGDTSLSVSLVLQSNMTLAPVFDQVGPNTPVAEFSVTPDPPMWIAPLTVTFADQSTGSPTAWTWDFGDGASDGTQNPTHTYTTPGTYTVTLRVDNANGPGTPIVKTALVYVASPDEGSRYWYQTDRYGNPFKTHDAGQADFANQVLALVNQERAAVGAPALSFDAEAERAAKAHSDDMVARGYFDHISPEGWDPGARLQMTGASGYRSFGENIALGQQTPAAVMQAWMNSPGHRANILNPAFTHLGVGIANGPRWTQVFLTR